MILESTKLKDAFRREIFFGDIVAVSSDYREDLLPMEVVGATVSHDKPQLILARCDGEESMLGGGTDAHVSDLTGFYLFGTYKRSAMSAVIIRPVDGRSFGDFTPGNI